MKTIYVVIARNEETVIFEGTRNEAIEFGYGKNGCRIMRKSAWILSRYPFGYEKP